MKYSIGQQIYYRGDMANRPGWFEITDIVNDKYIKGYDLKEINGDREIKRLPEVMISDVDKGNGLTRFVTKEAHEEFRRKALAALQK